MDAGEGGAVNAPLTPEEVAELIALVPRGRSAWKWIRHDGVRVDSPVVEHDGRQITSATADGPHTPDTIARAVLGALRQLHVRWSAAAHKAAATRARRQELRVYRVARAVLQHNGIRPGRTCAVCGYALADPDSQARGVGPECWGTVLEMVEHLRAEEARP